MYIGMFFLLCIIVGFHRIGQFDNGIGSFLVYVSIIDAYKTKRRPEALGDALQALNEHLANGWSVKQSSPLGTGSEAAACNLVILEKE